MLFNVNSSESVNWHCLSVAIQGKIIQHQAVLHETMTEILQHCSNRFHYCCLLDICSNNAFAVFGFEK